MHFFKTLKRSLLFLLLILTLCSAGPGTLSASARQGWQKSGGDYIYIKKNGKIATNKWVRRNGKKVFVGEDGKIIENFKGGFYEINGKWYFYTSEGKKKTGWITYKKKLYYLDSDGARVTKWLIIGDQTYYFSKSGKLRTSSWVKHGKWYYRCDKNGKVDTTQYMNTKDISTATEIRYQTGTLKVAISRQTKYNANYWVATVEILSPSQMFSPLSYGTYGGSRELTSHAVTSNNAIIGINGSAFSYSSGKPGFDAVMIKDGTIYNRALGTSYSVMAIAKDGTLFNPSQGLSAEALVKANVRDTFNFGPVLIKNGKAQAVDTKNFSLMTYKDPRTAVGMVRPGKYVLLVADGRGAGGSRGLNQKEMIKILQSFGCTFAYNLDGGGSSTLVFRGRVLNNPSDGSERGCGDFLCFKN